MISLKNVLLALSKTTPVGTVQAYAGSTAPSGWLFCRGQAVSRTTYASLYSVIGTTYGSGDGSTTFNLPDLQGKVAVGVSTSDSDFDLADTGGAKGAWRHSHTYYWNPGNQGGYDAFRMVGDSGSGTSTTASGSTNNTLNVDKANMPPYIALNYIIWGGIA